VLECSMCSIAVDEGLMVNERVICRACVMDTRIEDLCNALSASASARTGWWNRNKHAAPGTGSTRSRDRVEAD
jgi:hypothetical protein